MTGASGGGEGGDGGRCEEVRTETILTPGARPERGQVERNTLQDKSAWSRMETSTSPLGVSSMRQSVAC